MKRYTDRSSIKRVHVLKSAKKEAFFAEVIYEPYQTIPKNLHNKFLIEVGELVEKAWGEFPKKYLTDSILKSRYLLLLRNKNKELVGVAPIKKIQINGRYVYSFGLTAVDPDYQSLGFMKIMHGMLGRRVFAENILKLKLEIEFVFITPNIRTIGTLSRIADHIYPNPYLIDEKTGEIDYADDETWKTVKLFLEKTGETYRKLDRRGCVMVGFYDDKPNLVVQRDKHIADKKLTMFAKKYLKPGNEIVVRAKIHLWGLLRNGF
jgi:hypothetical protein